MRKSREKRRERERESKKKCDLEFLPQNTVGLSVLYFTSMSRKNARSKC